MAVKKVELENITVFDKMNIEFADGINIFIGENGESIPTGRFQHSTFSEQEK